MRGAEPTGGRASRVQAALERSTRWAGGMPSSRHTARQGALDGTRRAFRLRLAQGLWETEQYYQAMNEWRSVLGQDPGNIEARLGLARATAKSGDRAAAAQEYRRILQMVPNQPEARRELERLGRARDSWPA